MQGPQPVTYKQFAGLRNTTSTERLGPADLSRAINVDIDDAGQLSRRGGQRPIEESRGGETAVHSLWADGDLCLFVTADSLVRMDEALTHYPLRDSLTLDARMSYVRLLDRAFWSNGSETGCVQGGVNRSWGLPVHPSMAAEVGGGMLPPGRYQYLATWIRSDGQEGGAGVSSVLELTTAGGIVWPELPESPDPDITHRALYLSPCNGQTLYRALVLPVEQSATAYCNDGLDLAAPLATQFMGPAPAAQALAYYRGRIYAAAGSTLYPSEPHLPELFRLDRSFLPFADPVRVIAPVKDGLFVGTDKEVLFLAGTEPGSFTQETVSVFGAVAGTLAYADGAQVGQGMTGTVALFVTGRGLVAGGTGGQFVPLSDPRYRLPAVGTRGAGLWRQSPGRNQYVVALET